MAVFHIKYRPKSLAELDLPDIGDRLKKILAAKDLPQSFLFAGPKGSGKTSAARIVSKVLNCLSPVKGDACLECKNCQEIDKMSSIDILEIDAASNRGIEDVRGLKEKAFLLPAKLKRKVLIIDEVHMLTKEAFNALLKLIEEPPTQTFFILCTTDPGKIPETVLSRLVRIDFRKGKATELLSSLKRIIDAEKIEIEEEAINQIIEKSDGSFRNIQRTLNELVMEYGNKISADGIGTYLVAKFGEYLPTEIEEDLVKGEVKVILTKMEKLASKGVDFKSFRENLMTYFQDKLLGMCGVDGKGKSKMSVEQLEKWLQLLILASKQEKDVSIDQLPVELAVVEFLKEKINNEKLIINNEKTDDKPKKDVEINDDVGNGLKPLRTNEKIDVGFGVEKIESEWGKILVAVKPYNHSVEAFLRAARPMSVNGNVVTLEVFYPFHKDKLEEQKNRKIVEEGFKRVMGVEMIMDCVLGSGKKESLVINNETPVSLVSEKTAVNSNDIYDVAKEIFG
jgi:DNA polymerase III subunit gamma/tau